MLRQIIVKYITFCWFWFALIAIAANQSKSVSAEIKIFDNISLKKADKFNCKILGVYKTQRKYNIHVINSILPDAINYYLLEHGQECLSFRVRTKNNANLKLSNNNYEFSIVLGGWNNIKSIIRLNNITVATAEINDLLCHSEFRYFWISWSNGTLQIGKNMDKVPFLYYHYSIRIETEFIGFQIKGSTGLWVIGEENPNCFGIDHFEEKFCQVQCVLNEQDDDTYFV